MGQCSYTCDITAPRFDDLDGSSWRCPHPAHAATDTCLFHLRHVTDAAIHEDGVRAAVINAIRSDSDERNRFIDARLPHLNLNHLLLEGPSRAPIDFRNAQIDGPCDAQDAEIRHPLLFDGTVFRGNARFEHTVFRGNTRFQQCRFEQEGRFRLATFDAWADFTQAQFQDDAYFRMAFFNKGLAGEGMEFHRSADFINADFVQVANFFGSTFRQGAIFSSARFQGDAKFTCCQFHGPTTLSPSTGSKHAFEVRRPEYAAGVFENDCLVMSSTQCAGDLQLSGAGFDANVCIVESTLGSHLELSDNTNNAEEPLTLAFHDVDFISGHIHASSGFTYDLSSSVLGDVDLRLDGDRIDFSCFTFDGAAFDGFDFGRYRNHFRANRWDLFDGREASASVQENTYLRAKNGAIQMGENTAAREFHYREMLNRGRSYLNRCVRTSMFRARKGRLRATRLKLYFFGTWLINLLFRFTCGYGERPGRVIAFSTAIILSFALLYPLTGVYFQTASVLEPLAFSFQSFNAVFLGKPPVNTLAASVLVSIEGFLGPFFIALFVFTITQSLSR